MKWLLFIGICIEIIFGAIPVIAQTDTAQRVRGRTNAANQREKPYVILISADGFRYDYITRFSAPFLERMTEKGVHSPWMIPAFPSLTFPNHYSMITGLFPAHHGIISNQFIDLKLKAAFSSQERSEIINQRWYGGHPLWEVAESQGMLTASYFWVGSETMGEFGPNYFYYFNRDTPIEQRIDAVTSWLSLPLDKRPHLIMFYMPEVDYAGHLYGPESSEVASAVAFVDSAVSKLYNRIDALGLSVNFIFASDHGMLTVNQSNAIRMPSILTDTTDVKLAITGQVIHVYIKNGERVNYIFERLQTGDNRYNVYRKEAVPVNMRYSSKEDRFNRLGDIILVANPPYVFKTSARNPNPGAHGYNPKQSKEMMSIFRAWGPDIKEGKKIRPFNNVDIYILVADLLDLQINEALDADRKTSKRIRK